MGWTCILCCGWFVNWKLLCSRTWRLLQQNITSVFGHLCHFQRVGTSWSTELFCFWSLVLTTFRELGHPGLLNCSVFGHLYHFQRVGTSWSVELFCFWSLVLITFRELGHPGLLNCSVFGHWYWSLSESWDILVCWIVLFLVTGIDHFQRVGTSKSIELFCFWSLVLITFRELGHPGLLNCSVFGHWYWSLSASWDIQVYWIVLFLVTCIDHLQRDWTSWSVELFCFWSLVLITFRELGHPGLLNCSVFGHWYWSLSERLDILVYWIVLFLVACIDHLQRVGTSWSTELLCFWSLVLIIYRELGHPGLLNCSVFGHLYWSPSESWDILVYWIVVFLVTGIDHLQRVGTSWSTELFCFWSLVLITSESWDILVYWIVLFLVTGIDHLQRVGTSWSTELFCFWSLVLITFRELGHPSLLNCSVFGHLYWSLSESWDIQVYWIVLFLVTCIDHFQRVGASWSTELFCFWTLVLITFRELGHPDLLNCSVLGHLYWSLSESWDILVYWIVLFLVTGIDHFQRVGTSWSIELFCFWSLVLITFRELGHLALLNCSVFGHLYLSPSESWDIQVYWIVLFLVTCIDHFRELGHPSLLNCSVFGHLYWSLSESWDILVYWIVVFLVTGIDHFQRVGTSWYIELFCFWSLVLITFRELGHPGLLNCCVFGHWYWSFSESWDILVYWIVVFLVTGIDHLQKVGTSWSVELFCFWLLVLITSRELGHPSLLNCSVFGHWYWSPSESWDILVYWIVVFGHWYWSPSESWDILVCWIVLFLYTGIDHFQRVGTSWSVELFCFWSLVLITFREIGHPGLLNCSVFGHLYWSLSESWDILIYWIVLFLVTCIDYLQRDWTSWSIELFCFWSLVLITFRELGHPSLLNCSVFSHLYWLPSERLDILVYWIVWAVAIGLVILMSGSFTE